MSLVQLFFPVGLQEMVAEDFPYVASSIFQWSALQLVNSMFHGPQ